MSIWAQVGDDRVTTIPPDGKTIVDVYAGFSFGGNQLPDGTPINFLIGKGDVPDTAKSLSDIQAALTPMDGVEFIDPIGIMQTTFVRDQAGNLTAQKVANVKIKPIADILKDNITIVAYSTFDKLGLVKRFSFGLLKLTVSSGEGLFLSSIERYDPIGNAWTTKSSMPTGRSGLFCETVNNKIYAIGGFNSNFTAVNEQYDPALDVWTVKAPMSSARGFGCSAVVAGKIYTIGGYSFAPGRANTTVERYDPIANSWTTLTSLPFPLAFSCCQVVGTSIYVRNGATRFSDNDNPIIFNSGILKFDTTANAGLGAWSIQDAIVSGATSTMLTAAAATGSFICTVSNAAIFPGTGFITLDRGTPNQETVRFSSYSNGVFTLPVALQFNHTTSSTVIDATTPVNRVACNSFVSGNRFYSFNGISSAQVLLSSVDYYDIVTKNYITTAFDSTVARQKSGQALIGTKLYVVDGSSGKSDYSSTTQSVDTGTVAFTNGLAKNNVFRTSFGATAANDGIGNFVYIMGGQGSGHSAGWLKMDVKVNPETIRADGRATASITVSAVDAAGDPPPNGIKVKIRGLLYVNPPPTAVTGAEAATAVATSTQTKATTTTGAATTQERNPTPTISLLPVLFSANETTLVQGLASTILLARSEDQINEVQNLLNFVKGQEKTIGIDALKKSPTAFDNSTQQAGSKRDLYNIAIEIVIEDALYFGQTDSNATTNNSTDSSLTSSSFSFNPPSATQGKSGKVSFFSDITSIPDVELLTDVPTDLTTLLTKIDKLKQEIPFGASPHYDALMAGGQSRIVDPPALPKLPPANIMVSASDNSNSLSANSASDVISEVNLVNGTKGFPVFITTVVVTDPLSLAARAARTDVSDLELIASETGGSSFSLDNAAYVNFIVDRIKTSAPSSIGSGKIVVRHPVQGSILTLRFSVDNMITGNSAVLTARYSTDGYNFKDLGVNLQATNGAGLIISTFTLGSPVMAQFIEYTVNLSSKSFNSPILRSVVIQYIKPNVQYLFTYPQTVGGQVSELSAVTNERLPAGSKVEVGLVHGDSFEFDRDFVSTTQPAVSERGSIFAIQRTAPILDGAIFRDLMDTTDFILYRSRSGPWALDSITKVFANEQEVLPTDFIAVPEQGVIVFKNKRDPKDIIGIEIENQARFKLGLKITNPTLQSGVLDSFAFMYGETDADTGLKPNRPPLATNLFISPSPVFPGGPIEANYTFTDPDGDAEDPQTQIIWFRNNAPVSELNNKKSFSNTDLVARRTDGSSNYLISKGQQWFFTVRPSDGKAYGPLAVSHSVTIANNPPTGTNAQLKSTNAKDPSTFTSSDGITATYTYSDPDGDAEFGTIYSFFVNGVAIKTGTENSIAADEQDASGNKIIGLGKTIRCDITPCDGSDFGALISSLPITIGGTAPSVANVTVSPVKPTAASSLLVTYSFVSIDNGPDQSTIAWFANSTRQTTFDNLSQVPRGNLKPGQQWYAIVTPSDGTTQGTPIKSNVILIQQ